MAKENANDPFPGPRPLACHALGQATWARGQGVPGQAGQAVSRQGRAASEGQDHSLVKPNEIILWQRFTFRVVKYYKGKAKEGRPPYLPSDHRLENSGTN